MANWTTIALGRKVRRIRESTENTNKAVLGITGDILADPMQYSHQEMVIVFLQIQEHIRINQSMLKAECKKEWKKVDTTK